MIKYFANPMSNDACRKAMLDGIIGWIDTPVQGNKRPPGLIWCADNGCYGKGYVEAKWWRFLENNVHDLDTCVFATAPDRVGDARTTLEMSLPWLPKMRQLGYPAALVFQDGLNELPIPWDDFDVMFIGGTNDWKLGPHIPPLVAEANERGKHVHMGRVNSYRRLKLAHDMGCHSADGTYLKFGPQENLVKLLGWLRKLEESEGAMA